MKIRLWRVISYSVIILIVGLLYGLFVKKTGIAVPCMFYRLTGWKCPGCGVTRMCVALLQLRWRDAFWFHPMLFVQLPVLGLIAIRNVVTYVKNGVSRVTRPETAVIYICIVLLVIFTVFRNMVGL